MLLMLWFKFRPFLSSFEKQTNEMMSRLSFVNWNDVQPVILPSSNSISAILLAHIHGRGEQQHPSAFSRGGSFRFAKNKKLCSVC